MSAREVSINEAGFMTMRVEPKEAEKEPSPNTSYYTDREGQQASEQVMNYSNRMLIPVAEIASGPSLVAELEKMYEENREEIVQEMIITPLHVLKELASEFSVPIKIKTFEIHVPQNLAGPEKIIQRVTINVGHLDGDSESPRYRLSLQLAAADLLSKIKTMKTINLPIYGMLPGSRVNPWIYRDLRELCDLEKLASRPSFERIWNPQEIGSDKRFAFKCIIGQAESFGSSDSIFLAKRLSAKSMYEQLTDEEYPGDRVATGKSCIQDADLRKMGINPAKSNLIKSPKAPPKSAKSSPSYSMTSAGGFTPMSTLTEDMYEDEFAEDEDNIDLQLQLMSVRLS